MFDVGGPEFLVLLLLALLVFGPRRMPEIGRMLGHYAGQFRRSWNEMRRTIEREAALEDLRAAGKEIKGIQSDARSLARDLKTTTGAVSREIEAVADVATPSKADRDEETPSSTPPSEDRS